MVTHAEWVSVLVHELRQETRSSFVVWCHSTMERL